MQDYGMNIGQNERMKNYHGKIDANDKFEKLDRFCCCDMFNQLCNKGK